MELELQNGRYTPAANGMLREVSGVNELAQRITMKLAARRGAFAPMPNYGSRIYTILKVPPHERETKLREFIYEALRDEQGVKLTKITLSTEAQTLKIWLDFACSTGDFAIELTAQEETYI